MALIARVYVNDDQIGVIAARRTRRGFNGRGPQQDDVFEYEVTSTMNGASRHATVTHRYGDGAAALIAKAAEAVAGVPTMPTTRKEAAAFTTARTPSGQVPFRGCRRCRGYSWWVDSRQAWVCRHGHESRVGDQEAWERKDKYAPPAGQSGVGS